MYAGIKIQLYPAILGLPIGGFFRIFRRILKWGTSKINSSNNKNSFSIFVILLSCLCLSSIPLNLILISVINFFILSNESILWTNHFVWIWYTIALIIVIFFSCRDQVEPDAVPIAIHSMVFLLLILLLWSTLHFFLMWNQKWNPNWIGIVKCDPWIHMCVFYPLSCS